ncbi:MAG: hypothetical protein HOY71_19635 [Nonomuraea sp.]|nr:hypothetical protein [Nonomuraea sp.]
MTSPDKPTGAPVLSILGFVSAAIAILFFPIVFGPAGIVLGVVGHYRGENLGRWAAVTAAVTMVVGFVLGYLVRRAVS